MKIFTTANNFVTLITKNATPYTIEGRAGITYRVVVMSGDDVEKLKVVDKDVYDLLEPGKHYQLTGQFEVRNGRYSEWKVDGFVQD